MHFKEDHCTQDGNHCQPVYLQFMLKQVFLPAAFLKMCCLGIQEMHFLHLKTVHTAVWYYFHWALGIFTLLFHQQLIWWSLFKVSLPWTCCPSFTCTNKRGPEESPELQAADLLLLKSENWFQLSTGNIGALAPSTISFPSYLARVFSSPQMVMLPQPQKKAAFSDWSYEFPISWATLNWGILCKDLVSSVISMINNSSRNCFKN